MQDEQGAEAGLFIFQQRYAPNTAWRNYITGHQFLNYKF